MYRKIALNPLVAPYVKEILIQDLDAAENNTGDYYVFPTPYPVMGFQYRGKLEVIRDNRVEALSPMGITGLQTTARQFRPKENAHTILITFFPYGIFPLLQHPMNEIADRHLGLNTFLAPNRLTLFEEQLSEANNISTLESLVQRFLIANIQVSRFLPPDVLATASKHILASHGRIRVESIAEKYGIGRRQLERLFQLYIGMSPKDFASLARFDWSLNKIHNYRSFAELALAAGYADQAHLSRNFMRYAGLTLKQFSTTYPEEGAQKDVAFVQDHNNLRE